MTAGPRRIDALDVSPEVLVAAMGATHSESDRVAYAQDISLVAHPEWCSTTADYPGWVPPRMDPKDFARSVREGFEPEITWGEQPERRRPEGYSPDCQPEFATPKRLAGAQDVQTGGAL